MEMEEEKIAQLQEMTGLRADEARTYLEDSAWDINSALTAFFTQKTKEACSRPAREPQPQPRIQRGNPRLVTMADIRNNQGQSHENRQAFYVGGSERSGQQVIGPESNRNRDLLAAMLEAGQSEDSEDEEGSVGSRERREVVLRLWSEGFTVDDGRLREYSDPANSQFLEKIRGGFIPEELVTEARGGTVHCRMEDHRSERYVPSKQKLKAFSGVGHMLGSPTPIVTTDAGATAGDQAEPKKEEEEVAPREPPFTLDPAVPTTSVQIRLADGTRLQATLNHGHTVADLRRFIVHERPQYANVPFNLLNSYPSKLLTDDALTLESAGILNASLLQRLV